MKRGTLSRQLVLRVATLVALVALTLGAVSLVAVQRILLDQAQGQLVSALSIQDKGLAPDSDDPAQTAPRVRGINIPGLPPGTIVVTSNNQVRGGRITSGSIEAISSDLAQTLLQLPTGESQQVNVPGYGEYLAEKVDRGYETDVVAIPLEGVSSVVHKLLALEAVLATVAVAATAVVSRALIVRSLRPLNQLAAAATHVSNLELDRGEVSLAVRVPANEADPDNEVGRVGHAFNHMLNNVEGALAARQASETKLRQFVADASHELRNPLAAIRGYAELTRRSREELPTDTAYAMGRIEAESGRMSKLVEDMLLLARLDNDPDLDLKPVDVVELVLNAVNDARVAGPEQTWRLDLPDETITARADANRLHQ
ncbi:MAG: HAMP domain-containing sensor histidine kinase, partial [Propionibacterium sp.]|nr:HAMP domain-containing sensor histidine kinase [Propionibacterium sp.]